MSAVRRNSGCRITDDIKYKGLGSLIMENELLRVFILVEKGTDILELLYKPRDIDFMWKSPKTFREGEIDRKDFLESYLGGWQEIVPNGGSPCIYKGASLGLHDETPMIPWAYDILEDNQSKISVRFYTKLSKVPLSIEKTLTLKSNSSVLSIEEKVTNNGSEELDFMWGHHPCFGSPFLSSKCVINFNAKEIVSNPGSISSFPMVMPGASGKLRAFPGKNGQMVDLSKVLDKNAKFTDLLYAKDLNENWFSVTNLEENLGIGFVFDPAIFRYIYLWLAYGGSDNYPWYSGTYSLAVEPWSSYPGLGLPECIKNNTALKIAPGEVKTAWLKTVVYEKENDVEKIDDSGAVW